MAPAPTTSAGGCYRYRAAERTLARATNTARRRHHLSALQLDRHVSYVARVHSRAMAKGRTVFHTPSQTLAWRVTRWRSLGENVGAGGGVRRVHRAFMRSAGHRTNVFRSGFRHFGVGVVRAGGRAWVTVVFEARRDPGTRLRMPRCRTRDRRSRTPNPMPKS
ncbi:MAG: CAP domain-containing protein [Actinomycetota bacterium]